MKKRNIFGGLLIVLACAGMSMDSRAALTITIADYNFNGTESFTTSTPWVPQVTGEGTTSVGETTTPSGFSGTTIPGGTGAGVGYIQFGYNSTGPITMNQTLNGLNGTTLAILQASSTYTLSGYIGYNGGDTQYFNYSGATYYVQLWAGSTELASSNESLPAAGDFNSWSINYTSPSSGVPSGDLEIVLGMSGGNDGNTDHGQVQWADISLTEVPEKENEALALFGILAVGGTAGRRLVALRNSPKF